MYILDEQGHPVRCNDLDEWSRWFELDERRIVRKQTFDNITVSTVFLGIDHGWRHDHPPVLWETMVFGGEQDNNMWRWTSLADAIAGHNTVVRALGGLVLEDT